MLHLKYFAKENEVHAASLGNISVGEGDPKWLKEKYDTGARTHSIIRVNIQDLHWS